jgi:hypothetical protein
MVAPSRGNAVMNASRIAPIPEALRADRTPLAADAVVGGRGRKPARQQGL